MKYYFQLTTLSLTLLMKILRLKMKMLKVKKISLSKKVTTVVMTATKLMMAKIVRKRQYYTVPFLVSSYSNLVQNYYLRPCS